MRQRFLHFSMLVTALFLAGISYSQTISITSGSGTTICHGVSDTFTATTTGASGDGFAWELNGATITGATLSTYITSTLANGDMVSCLLTNVSGTTVATSNTITMTIDSLPVIAPITGEDSVCAGDTIHLYDPTPGGVWSSTNPMAATIDAAGVVSGIAPAAPGTPTLRMVYKLTNGCGTDSIRFRVRVNIPAGPATGPAEICMDSIAVFTDTARGIWASSDTTIANFVAPFGLLQGFTPGTVSVYYHLANACGSYADTLSLQVVHCDSAAAVPVISNLDKALHIYPNPNSGTCTISMDENYTNAHCIVSNVLGEKVKEITVSSGKPTDLTVGNQPGIYFITVSAGNETYTSKIVVVQ